MPVRPPIDPVPHAHLGDEDLGDEGGRRLWRSPEELAAAPEVSRHLEAEFPGSVEPGVIDRREWLRLMGASLMLTDLTACGSHRAITGAPLLSHPRGRPEAAPGEPVVFATSLELDGYGRGALVRTQDGRPVKIEGNPLHPATLGATDPFLQAEVLSLYDPGRSRTPHENGAPRDWQTLLRFLRPLRNELVVNEGRGLSVLLPPIASPTLNRLVELARQLFPHARWHLFSPMVDDQHRGGMERAFGRPVDLVYDLTQADMIVTLGGDLFTVEPGHIRHAADWQARRRAADRPLPRLFAVETTPSLAGARADERLALRPRDVEAIARALAASLGLLGGAVSDPHPAAARLARGLAAAGERGLVAAGREQPPSVHALAAAINHRLGAFGRTVRAIEPVRPPVDTAASIMALAEAIAADEVSHLLILGGNPAYDAPADLDLPALIRRVRLSLHVGYAFDETASACRWHVPRCHALEAFGDLRAFDGTLGLCQPAVARLAPSLSLEETLGLLAGQNLDGRGLVAATWREAWGEAFESRFARALEDGVVADTAFPPVEVALRPDWDSGPRDPAADASYDVVFAPDSSVWDGRFANNGWLQELPRPLTKQVWGNAALIAPETANSLGVRSGDVVEIVSEGRAIAAPVWVLPGHAPGAVTLPLGYGRTNTGGLGEGVGFDAYRLRTASAPWRTRAEIRKIDRREALVTTQLHHAMQGRALVRAVAPGEALPKEEPQPSLYPDWPYEGHAWGMVIDLDACIGCNACVVACQAENNVAVVGPEEVARGREMHWLRVDRYYAGAPDAPSTYFQPVPCMHCETAPCEVVCPVNATVHSAEGLNDMVYNRCVGTRTCSNNCPYKVRRFNFIDYRATAFAPDDDVLNPQVTVRSRGVMEKCTYCVQRISAARIAARIEDRPIRDGEIVTACEQACPTQAIVFGDVNDPDSRVSRLKREPRHYALLPELNTRPRTTYLARIERKDERPPTPSGEAGR